MNAVFDADTHLVRQSRTWALEFAAEPEAQVFSSHFRAPQPAKFIVASTAIDGYRGMRRTPRRLG